MENFVVYHINFSILLVLLLSAIYRVCISLCVVKTEQDDFLIGDQKSNEWGREGDLLCSLFVST